YLIEELQRVVTPTEHRQAIDEPESAQQKCRLISFESIVSLLQVISQNEPIDSQFAFDGLNRCDYAWVRYRQKADKGDEQEARIQRSRAVALHKRANLRIEPILTNIFVYSVAKRTPLVQWSGKVESFKILNGAIHSNPCHHFRVRKLFPLSTNFPDAFIGLPPSCFEVRDPRPL